MRWSPPEGYLTIPDAAERLGCSTHSIRRLIKTEELECIYLEGLYGVECFIKMQDINQEQPVAVADLYQPSRSYSFAQHPRAISNAVASCDVRSTFNVEELSANVSDLRKKMVFTPEAVNVAPPKKAFLSKLLGR